MRVNLDQLIEAAGAISPHNPLYQITIRAFDSNGHVPMRVVLEIGGLPFALRALDTVLPPGDKRIAEFNRRCERGVIRSAILRVLDSGDYLRFGDARNQSKTRPFAGIQGTQPGNSTTNKIVQRIVLCGR